MPFHSLRQTFEDIDEMCEKMHGWDMRLMPLKSGKLTHGINQFSSQYVVVQNLMIGQKAHHAGAACKHRVTFGLPSITESQVDLNSRSINDTLVIFSQGDEFSSVSPEGYSPSAISIDRTWLQQLAISHQIPIDIETIDNKNTIIPISSQMKAQLKRIFICIASEQYNIERREHLLQYELPLLLLQLSLKQEQVTTFKTLTKINGMAKAFNFIQLNSKSPITIKQICDASHIQERSLERMFREYFDITPNNYLRLYRLQQAKINIKKSKGSARVSYIASNCGFTHLGRFSNYYEKFFNELPKDTTRKSREKIA